MGKRLIVLHAGLHKTGTTSFQAWVQDNRDRWPDDFYFIAKPHPAARYLHDCVEQALRWGCGTAGTDLVEAAAHALTLEIPLDAERVIVSLESLCGPMPDGHGALVYPAAGKLIAAAVAGLRGSGAEVRLVLTNRQLNDWVQSVYAHQYRRGVTNLSFAEFAETEQIRLIMRVGLRRCADQIHARAQADAPDLPYCEVGFAGPNILHRAMLSTAEYSAWRPLQVLNAGVSPETFIAMQMPVVRRLPHFLRRRAIDWLERSPKLREFVAPAVEGSR